MTAVEWLIQQIDNEDMGEIPMWVYDFCYKALEMEKKQITINCSVCTCINAELEKDRLVPVYCYNCNAYVQTDL